MENKKTFEDNDYILELLEWKINSIHVEENKNKFFQLLKNIEKDFDNINLNKLFFSLIWIIKKSKIENYKWRYKLSHINWISKLLTLTIKKEEENNIKLLIQKMETLNAFLKDLYISNKEKEKWIVFHMEKSNKILIKKIKTQLW